MIIQDDFSVGNHTNIDGQASSDGSFIWERIEGGSTALMRTSTSAFCDVVIGFADRCSYRAEKDFPSDDYYVQASISVGTDDGMRPGLLVRKDATATLTYYDCSVRGDTNVVRIRKRIAGTFTDLQNTAFTFNDSTFYLIKFEVQGNTLRVYVDGVQIGADLIDSSIPTGRRCGMVGGVSGATTKTGHIASFEGNDGIDFTEDIEETAAGVDRAYYDLTPAFPMTVREAAAAVDRTFYDLVTVLSGTVRETAGATDRNLYLNTAAVVGTVRESAVATDGLNSGTRISGLTQAPSGPSMAILTHIYDYFGPGLDWAFSDVRRTAPAHGHAGKVMTWGTSTREIPIPPGGPPRLGRLVLEFDDTPDPDTRIQFFRSQFGARTPKGKRVDLKIGISGGSEALFQIPAAGVIEHATFPPGKMRLEIPDVRYKQLQKPMPGLINDTNFANLPVGVKDGFSKWVAGEVSSVGFGAQGALPCIHVDTVLHRYDGARHIIDGATVYTKEPTETEFQVTPFTYSLVEEPVVIDGLPITFTFIQFASALPEGTEVRADIRGIPASGGWGTVPFAVGLTDNVVDHLVGLAYYFDGLEKGRFRTIGEAFATWDLTSMATVRQQFEDAGYSSAYAITEPLTPEVIYTQLLSTFMIHWFPSRLDKTKLVMTTVETPEDAPIFGDFHSILRESEQPELARDTRNRFFYNFAKIHEGVGRFAGHGTYDNTGDQAELLDSDGEPIIEPEEIDLHACRDADVALLLAVEWSTWRDQQAHRVSFELDMPTKLSRTDLARDFLITHYGGLEEGGWNRARFIPYRITDDFDRLKMRVDAIKRVQPAVIQNQSQDVGEWRKNSRVGPWYNPGNKTLFMCFADDQADLKKLVIIATVNE